MSWDTFEHTADLGLRVTAPDLEGLFRDAARGLFGVIVESVPELRPECVELSLEGTRKDWLLLDWLNELLFLFETRELLLGDFEIAVDDRGLRASARGAKVDLGRDRLLHEVKAITYHGLRVDHTADGWLAELIVDI